MRNHLAWLGIWWCLGIGVAHGAVIDAPHNDTNDIRCGDCHSYSLWWTTSPTGPASASYGQITDEICATCHDGSGAPGKLSHSAVTMAEMHNPLTGNWSTNCVDCHNPHEQAQMNWRGTDEADLFLATGTLVPGSMTYDAFTHQTTVAYQAADARLEWADPSVWSAKTATNRGLILMVSRETAEASFEVNDAVETTPITVGQADGAGTLTVQGRIDEALHDGATFALIYGQLVKDSILTPLDETRAVKFFNAKDPAGGFTDTATPPQGICQVCHSSTDYWHEDGTRTTHNPGTDCSSCHDALMGFKPTNADHGSYIGPVVSCVSCHKSDYISAVHKGNCAHCHTSPPELKPGLPGTLGSKRYCSDCHPSIAADFLAHPGALDHSAQVMPVSPCSTCHYHNQADVIAGIHGPGPAGCNRCHNLAAGGVLQGAAVAGPGDCKKCHASIATDFLHHEKASNHDGQVVVTPSCARCHDGDPLYDVHSGFCGLCHLLPGGQLKGSATGGPGDCQTCHQDFYTHPTTISHSLTVASEPSCTACHGTAHPVTGIHATNGCATCHDPAGNLIGSAAGHAILDAGFGNPNTCSICHDDKTAGHPAADHQTMNGGYVTSTLDGSCVSCHGGDPLAVVHNGNCMHCHTSLTASQIHVLKPGLAAGDCAGCHPTFGTSFTAHPKTMDHAGQVVTEAYCGTCHDADPVWNVHYYYNNVPATCGNCHEVNGVLRGSAAGKGTGKPPAGAVNDCVGCHVPPDYQNPLLHN